LRGAPNKEIDLGAKREHLLTMATAELSVVPVGREGAATGDVITEIRRRLEAQDRVRFRMQAMGTELEGSVEDILSLAGELHRIPLESGIPRAYTVLKIDERTDKEQSLEDKLSSVEERIRRDGPPSQRDYPPGD
jgi:uncharacterized protein (TIGR00106 family)